MKGLDNMTNLKRAVISYVEDWGQKLDAEIEEATARGEIPTYTEEEMRERANKIWELAHSGKEC